MGESLSRSIFPLLDYLELIPDMERAGFLRPSGARIRWQTESIEEIPHHAGGFLLDRGRFDRLLREHAKRVGVQVVCPAKVGTVGTVTSSQRPHQVHAKPQGGTESYDIEARYVVDASGRRQTIRGTRRRLAAQTLAICGHWRGNSFPKDHAIVESAPWGWAWGAPLPNGAFSAMTFVEPKFGTVDASQSPQEFYQQMLPSLKLFSPCADAQLERAVKVCDASIYLANETVGVDWIKVGESAFTLDPISSQGVQAAIRSGLQAATTIHTILKKPDCAVIAQEFYRDSQSEAVKRGVATSANMYAECRRFTKEKFWKTRLRLQKSDPRIRVSTELETLEHDLRLELSNSATLVNTPVIRGDFVSIALALDHPALERPLAYIEGIEIERLLEFLQSPSRAADLVLSWRSLMAESTAHQILRWMWNHRLLEPRSD